MDKNSSVHEYWIKELTNGNSEALKYIFELHYRALCYFASSIINDQQQAEDIAATSFMKLWKLHGHFKTAQNIKSFLYISTKNACLDYLKHLKRQSQAQKDYIYHLSNEEDYISTYLIEAEFLQQLNTEIETLPKKCKEVFKLIFFEGLKTNEIAEQLSLSVKTVRNHKANAVSLLKAQILKKKFLLLLYILLENIDK